MPKIPDEAVDWSVPDRLVEHTAFRRGPKLVAFRPWEIVGLFHSYGQDMDELSGAVRALDACGLIDWRDADAESLERQAANRHRLLTPFPDTFRLPAVTYVGVGGDLDEDGLSAEVTAPTVSHAGRVALHGG